MNNFKTFLAIIITCVFTKTTYSAGAEGGSPSPAPYVIGSSFLIAANVCLDAVNTIQIVRGTNNKVIPITGLFTGATQIAFGIGNYSTYEEIKGFSIFNIGLGTATMALSAWNLIANKKPKVKTTSFNLYSFPTQDQRVGCAFTYTRRF